MIELLIVIGIVSVLSVFAIMSLTGNRGKARDVKRKSDLRNLQKALELYKQCHTPPVLPNSLPSVNGTWLESTLPPPVGAVATCPANTTYMSNVPGDPSSTAAYYFSPTGVSYTLCTCLEAQNDTDPSVKTGGSCGATNCSTGIYQGKRYEITD